MTGIEITRHRPGKDIQDFLQAANVVFAGDRSWIPPLRMMLSDQLSPTASPFFAHADVALFTARKAGRLVGRISAQIDREHLARYKDKTGFFGFFDTIDDEEVGRALMEAACAWLADRGMVRVLGPISLSINQEVGLLVEGFDSPPMILMGHSRQYQQRIADACGLGKAKDVFAWKWSVVDEMPRRAQRALAQMRDLPEVTLREARIKDEILDLIAIQDDAWKDNWGHVSMTPAEARQLADDLKLLIDPTIVTVAEIDGELAGMALAIPNLNEVIRDFDGRLSPRNVAKLLWRMKVRHPRTARLGMLGIREKYRKQKKYMPLAVAMVCDLGQRGKRRGYEWGELSWTLEDNAPVNMLIKQCGGEVYKRYRIYEKALSRQSSASA